jgi:hypothetical protein
MPEYLAPGVCVVEVEWRAKPIPGVPTRIDDEELRAIALIVRERLARFSPQWTDFNDDDPGVTLLELFAWVGEVLMYRSETLPERGKVHADRLAALALTLVADREHAPGGVLRYVRFFCGWRARLIRWIAR